MPNVTFNGSTYSCTTAYKGSDYIHLLDSNGAMIVAFDGVSDFSGFSISGGSWTTPSDANCCIAVFHEDGMLMRGSKIANSVTLPASGWVGDSQVVNMANMTKNKTIVVSPNPANFTQYGEAGVYCSSQGTGTLTFKCSSTPTGDLVVNILVIGG